MSVKCIPTKPRFYSKTGGYWGIPIFLFLLQNIDCVWVTSLNHLGEAVLMCSNNFMFVNENKKKIIEKFSFLELKIKLLYVAWAFFCNEKLKLFPPNQDIVSFQKLITWLETP